MEDLIIRQIDMPPTVRGFTSVDDEGNFNIFINDRLSEDMRWRTLEHEMRHIIENHFFKSIVTSKK